MVYVHCRLMNNTSLLTFSRSETETDIGMNVEPTNNI